MLGASTSATTRNAATAVTHSTTQPVELDDVFSPREPTAEDVLGSSFSTDAPTVTLVAHTHTLGEHTPQAQSSWHRVNDDSVRSSPVSVTRTSGMLTEVLIEQAAAQSASTVPADAVPPKAEPTLQLRRSHSFSTLMTIPFALFMFVVTAVVAITVGVTTSRVVTATQQSVHTVTLETMHALVSDSAAVMLYTASLLDSMYTPRVTNFEDVRTLSSACRLLDQVDPNIQLRSITAVSVTYNQIAACMHGDDSAPSPHDLFAVGTTGGKTNGSWVVDPKTYRLKIPLQQWEPVAPGMENASAFVAGLDDLDGFYADAAKYRANPHDPTLASRVLWRYASMRPLMLSLTYPLSVYDTQEAVDKRVPEGRALLRIRMDASKIMQAAVGLANGTVRVVLVTGGLYDGTDNPQVSSVNWDQDISNDTSEWFSVVGGALQNNSRLSDLNDPTVKVALRHLNILDVINADPPAERRASFIHGGVPCIATFSRTITSQGLDNVILVVSRFEGKKGPVVGIAIPIFVCIPVSLVLVIGGFFLAFHRWFTVPIREMSHALYRSSTRSGNPQRIKVTHHTRAIAQISEMARLEEVYNDAMSQLRKVDSFLPPTAFTLTLPDSVVGMYERSNTVSREKETVHEDTDAKDTTTQAGTNNNNIVIGENAAVCTGVCLFPTLRAREGHRTTAFMDSAALASLSMPIALTQGSQTVNRGAYLPIPEDRDTGVYPFKSEADVSLFFANIADLVKHFSGQFYSLSPNVTELFFSHAVTRAMEQQGDEEAMSRAILEDALSAVLFCLNLQHWLDTRLSHLPSMVCVVDSAAYTAVARHLVSLEMSTLTLVGRRIYGALGSRLAELGSRLLLSEQTATLVQDHVRTIPMQPLTITPRGVSPFNVVLYEAVEGDVDDANWRTFAEVVRRAFSAMLRGLYGPAVGLLRSLAERSSTPPEWQLPFERYLYALREAAAAGRPLAPPPSLNRTGEFFGRTYQLNRLFTISQAMVAADSHTPFVWFPLKPFYSFAGLHARPPLPIRLQVVSTPTFAGLAVTTLLDPSWRKLRKASRRPSLLRRSGHDTFVSRALARYPFRAKNRASTDQSASSAAPFAKAASGSSTTVTSASLGHGGSLSQGESTLHNDEPVGFCDNFGAHWITPRTTRKDVSLFERFCVLDANALGLNGSLAIVTCFKAVTGADKALAMSRFSDLFPQLPPSRYIEPTVGYHLSLDANGQPSCLFTVSDYCSTGQLRLVLRRFGRILPLTAILQQFVDCAHGLLELHRAGLVHGYIQPEHILVTADGHAKIRVYFAGERAGALLVVPTNTCYVSPEVIRGEVPTTMSDVFASGLVLAEMLTGVVPWTWSAAAAANHTAAELSCVLEAGGSAFVEHVLRGDIVMGLSTACGASDDSTSPSASSPAVLDAPLSVHVAQRLSVYPSDTSAAFTRLLCTKTLELAVACTKEVPQERISLTAALARAEELLTQCLQRPKLLTSGVPLS